jgi:hypothetical protein
MMMMMDREAKLAQINFGLFPFSALLSSSSIIFSLENIQLSEHPDGYFSVFLSFLSFSFFLFLSVSRSSVRVVKVRRAFFPD